MSVLEIERAVNALPKRSRDALMKRLAQKWEDYQDLCSLLKAIAEPGERVAFDTLKKKLDAKFRNRRAKSAKVSRQAA